MVVRQTVKPAAQPMGYPVCRVWPAGRVGPVGPVGTPYHPVGTPYHPVGSNIPTGHHGPTVHHVPGGTAAGNGGSEAQKPKTHSSITPVAGSLAVIVGSYKGAVKRWAGRNGFAQFKWQGRYYDHIIRNKRELYAIRTYIRNNPHHLLQGRHDDEGFTDFLRGPQP
jgi:hypothetical protein